MGTPFLAEIKIISFNFPPEGWAFCNGQFLPINQNQALFSLLGTTYGGNGQTNFALPDLRGRIPLHFGNGIILGQKAGQESVTLNNAEMPAHGHVPNASANTGVAASPNNAVWAKQTTNHYASNPDASMNPASVLPVGGSQPHNNMPPFLVLNFVIALQGVFPSQNFNETFDEGEDNVSTIRS